MCSLRLCCTADLTKIHLAHEIFGPENIAGVADKATPRLCQVCVLLVEKLVAHPDTCHIVGSQSPRKNSGSHIDASHSRQPLVKGERLVRYEVNAVMPIHALAPPSSDSGCVRLSVSRCHRSVGAFPANGNDCFRQTTCSVFPMSCMPAAIIPSGMKPLIWFFVGRSSQAYFLERNSAMDDSIGGS